MNKQFELISDFKPRGSQPEAIQQLVAGLSRGNNFQTLLGVTGSGKTFTMAHVIEQYQKPTLVLAPNKTLAAQLHNEFKSFFPRNRVEYFVSFYDYYQPESYIPSKDQYIEKDSQINERIEQLRLSATASLSSRTDVIVVASVSCIYSAGNPSFYAGLGFEFKVAEQIDRKTILKKLVDIQYERNDLELKPGRFRVKGDTIDIIPGYMSNIIRIELFGDEIEQIFELDKTSLAILESWQYYTIYPAHHFVIPEEKLARAIEQIKVDLAERLPDLDPICAHRLRQRTRYDIEMIQETGFCKGIENYSRYLDDRQPGDKPFCLLDYFPPDFLLIVDESHQSLPQVTGMFKGDYSRKKNLVDYGFRLPSAFDNRPLKFEEFEEFMINNRTIFVSATPGDYEVKYSQQLVEQIIRPTGLVDPQVLIRPVQGQVDDLEKEIVNTIGDKNRVLITTLTKKLAEELSDYLARKGFKTRYLHSEIETIERSEIIRQLRLGIFDILVGINLLREGLDIPEVGFIGILDADKEGFLRNTRSLIQIIGRASRNIDSRVVLYADNTTRSISQAVEETNRRRNLQQAYNRQNNITPTPIIKPIQEKITYVKDVSHIPKSDIPRLIKNLEKEMSKAADALNFEYAILLRDKIDKLKKKNTP